MEDIRNTETTPTTTTTLPSTTTSSSIPDIKQEEQVLLPPSTKKSQPQHESQPQQSLLFQSQQETIHQDQALIQQQQQQQQQQQVPSSTNNDNFRLLVLGLPSSGARTRVETQLRISLVLVSVPPDVDQSNLVTPEGDLAPGAGKYANRVGKYPYLKLPKHAALKRRHKRLYKSGVPSEVCLSIDATVVRASDRNAGNILACPPCTVREQKREQRKLLAQNKTEFSSSESEEYNNKKESSPSDQHVLKEEKDAQDRKIVVFNCGQFLDFDEGRLELPMRLTCYCRHHKEASGFCVIFTARDSNGNIVATGETPPIITTDDHKSKLSLETQSTPLPANIPANAKVLKSQSNVNNALDISFVDSELPKILASTYKHPLPSSSSATSSTRSTPSLKPESSNNNLSSSDGPARNKRKSLNYHRSKKPYPSDGRPRKQNSTPQPLTPVYDGSNNNLQQQQQQQQQPQQEQQQDQSTYPFNISITKTSDSDFSSIFMPFLPPLTQQQQQQQQQQNSNQSDDINDLANSLSSSSFSSSFSNSNSILNASSSISSPTTSTTSTQLSSSLSSLTPSWISSSTPTTGANNINNINNHNNSSGESPQTPSVSSSSYPQFEINPLVFENPPPAHSSTPSFTSSTSTAFGEPHNAGGSSSRSSSASPLGTPPSPGASSESLFSFAAANNSSTNGYISSDGMSSSPQNSSIPLPSSTPTSTKNNTSRTNVNNIYDPLNLATRQIQQQQNGRQNQNHFSSPASALLNNDSMQIDNDDEAFQSVINAANSSLTKSNPANLLSSSTSTTVITNRHNTSNGSTSTNSINGNNNNSNNGTPTIARVIPCDGPTHGGIEVTILGQNFVPGLVVTFGEICATDTKHWSSTTIICTLPPSPHPGPVVVSFKADPKLLTSNATEFLSREEALMASQDASSMQFFTYRDTADRTIMELALQIVGMKMTGKIEDAKDVAVRLIGAGLNNGGSESASTSNGSTNAIQAKGFEGTIMRFLSLLDYSSKDLIPEEGTDNNNNSNSSSDGDNLKKLDQVDTKFCISLKTPQRQTLLHLATLLGFHRLVTFLLNRGIDVNVRDLNHYTALHFAAMCGRVSIARQLIEAGALTSTKTNEGQTPLDIARSYDQDDIVDAIMLTCSKVAPAPAPTSSSSSIYHSSRPPSALSQPDGKQSSPYRTPSYSSLRWNTSYSSLTGEYHADAEGDDESDDDDGDDERDDQGENDTDPSIGGPEEEEESYTTDSDLESRLARNKPTTISLTKSPKNVVNHDFLKRLKTDRMLYLFWLPVLVVALAYAMYSTLPLLRPFIVASTPRISSSMSLSWIRNQ